MAESVLAIDPGPIQSAWVSYDGEKPTSFGIDHNAELTEDIRGRVVYGNRMAVEMIASYGMPVGADVFDTCVWIGRFMQAWEEQQFCGCDLVYRKDVKMHLCGTPRAKDANIRQALIDRFGGVGGKAVAVGTKKDPGPLYGIKSHLWAALAVAVTWHDQNVTERTEA